MRAAQMFLETTFEPNQIQVRISIQTLIDDSSPTGSSPTGLKFKMNCKFEASETKSSNEQMWSRYRNFNPQPRKALKSKVESESNCLEKIVEANKCDQGL